MLCTAIASVISEAERLAAAERHADADAFGQRVRRHRRDDHDGLARVDAAHRSDRELTVVEHDLVSAMNIAPATAPTPVPRPAEAPALAEQRDARGEHESGRPALATPSHRRPGWTNATGSRRDRSRAR